MIMNYKQKKNFLNWILKLSIIIIIGFLLINIGYYLIEYYFPNILKNYILHCSEDELTYSNIDNDNNDNNSLLNKPVVHFGPKDSPIFNLIGNQLLNCISTGTIIIASYAIGKRVSKKLIELNSEKYLNIFNKNNSNLNKSKILGNANVTLTIGSTTLLTSWNLLMQNSLENSNKSLIQTKIENGNLYNNQYYLDKHKEMLNKIYDNYHKNFSDDKCEFINEILQNEQMNMLVNESDDFIARSPLEFLYKIDDGYLSILVCSFFLILVGLYTLTVVIINLKYPNLFLIKNKLKNKYIIAYFDFINYIRGPILNILIIITYLLFISALIFIYYLIYNYPFG